MTSSSRQLCQFHYIAVLILTLAQAVVNPMRQPACMMGSLCLHSRPLNDFDQVAAAAAQPLQSSILCSHSLVSLDDCAECCSRATMNYRAPSPPISPSRYCATRAGTAMSDALNFPALVCALPVEKRGGFLHPHALATCGGLLDCTWAVSLWV